MTTVRKSRLPNGVWLVATLAILALGFTTLAWQWHSAHLAARKVHHHGARHKTPESTVAAEPNNR
jgi:hypothetical protein